MVAELTLSYTMKAHSRFVYLREAAIVSHRRLLLQLASVLADINCCGALQLIPFFG